MPSGHFFFCSSADISMWEHGQLIKRNSLTEELCPHKGPNQNTQNRCLNISSHRKGFIAITLYLFCTNTGSQILLTEKFVCWSDGLFLGLYKLIFLSCFVNNIKHYGYFLGFLCYLSILVPKDSCGESEPLSTSTTKKSHPVPKEPMILDKDKISPPEQTPPFFYSKSRTGVLCVAQKQPFRPRKNSLQMSLPGTVCCQSKIKTQS